MHQIFKTEKKFKSIGKFSVEYSLIAFTNILASVIDLQLSNKGYISTSGEVKDMNIILDEMGEKWATLGKDE